MHASSGCLSPDAFGLGFLFAPAPAPCTGRKERGTLGELIRGLGRRPQVIRTTTGEIHSAFHDTFIVVPHTIGDEVGIDQASLNSFQNVVRHGLALLCGTVRDRILNITTILIFE